MYLISDDKVMVQEAEFESFELKFSQPLPSGYVQFLKQYGIGTYCGTLEVHSPSEIESKSEELVRSLSNKYWKNEKDKEFIGTLVNPFQICESIDQDRVFFVPNIQEKLFVLPRHDSQLYTLGSDFLQPTIWYLEDEAVRKPEPFEYFEPAVDSDTMFLIFESCEMNLDEIVSFLKNGFGSDVVRVDDADCTQLFIKKVGGLVQLELHNSGGGIRFYFRPKYHQCIDNILTNICANKKFTNVRWFA